MMNFNVVFDDQDNVDVDDVIADHDDIKKMPLELMMQIRVCFIFGVTHWWIYVSLHMQLLWSPQII